MNSRKKLTIALVSTILLLAAVVVALVAVLAAPTQSVGASFTVSYNADANVIADVTASYKAGQTKSSSLTFTDGTYFTGTGVSNGKISFGGGTASSSPAYSALAATTTNLASGAFVLKFTFKNNAPNNTLNMKFVITSPETLPTNLSIQCYKNSNWVNAHDQTFTVAKGASTDIYIFVDVPNRSANLASTTLSVQWNLSVS